MSLNVPALNELIAHLEKQPEERFNMGYMRFDDHPCGSAACIIGHSYVVWPDLMRRAHPRSVADYLGLDYKHNCALFAPFEWKSERVNKRLRWPLSRAIATLKRLRDVYEATGQVVVDWGPEPGEAPKKP